MKYPKLWNGTSAVGEALVRSLQRIRAPFLSAHTADGVIAGKMGHRLSEVKQEKDDEFIAMEWMAWSEAVITTPPPYSYYNVYTGVRSYDLQPSDLPDGYYLLSTHQYLGPLIISGGGPVMDPVPYSYSIVTTGFDPGYYANATGEWFAPLHWSGTGHRIHKWAVVNATKLNVVQRGVYEEDPDNITRPRGFRNSAAKLKPSKEVFLVRHVMVSGESGTIVGQSRLHKAKSLAVGAFEPYLLFPWSIEEHWVVGARWYGGSWWALTQGQSVTTGGASYVFRSTATGEWVQVLQTIAEYSWTMSVGKFGIAIGGWDGAGNNIAELYTQDGLLVGARKLGNAPLITGIDASRTSLFVSTYRDVPAEHGRDVIREFVIETLASHPTDYFLPPENVYEYGGHSPDGVEEPSDVSWYGASFLNNLIAYAGKKLFVFHTGGKATSLVGTDTGEVFLEVRSRDASTFKKSIKLDFASDENGYPEPAFGTLCAMRK